MLDCLEDRLAPATVNFTIDPTQDVKPISRYIYGVNQSLTGDYANLTLTRLGGNRWSTYNWENNASNAGSDWYFENDNYLGGGSTPGGAVIPTLENASAQDAAALLTIPINGYVAADEDGGGDVRNSGPNYLQTRFKQEVASKGVPFTLTPDPNGPYVYEDEFVNWVKTEFPYSVTDPNRPIWFDLDNEPDLWSSTQAEVHPAPTTYAEIVQDTITYASAIKNVMPNTLIFGPVSYGWEGYLSLQNAPDADGRNFLDYYLQQMQQAQTTYGKRLVDALDVHWYPEATGGGVRITGADTTPAVVAARLQAPRSLWAPTYTETSWITQDSTNGPIDLLPRLEGEINANYPGTKLSISEYNYGGGDDISGGIAEADVLGIFGQQGVFSAAKYPLAASEPFIAGAFEMYRNFNGNNGTFGDTSVLASSNDVPDSSVYASYDSANPNIMTLVVINKTNQPLPAAMQINDLVAGSTASIYQLTSANANPQYAGQTVISDPGSFNYTMPAYSVSTIRIVMPVNRAATTTGEIPNEILTVYGTGGNDTFTTAAESGQYTLNGVAYTYNPADVSVIQFLGQGGRATTYVTGTAAADTASLGPGSGKLRGASYEIDLTNVATIVVAGGGSNDIAYLTDAGGTNTFNGTPTHSWLDGNGFLSYVIGFKAVYATAGSGSHDIAYLTDVSGTNTFNGTPTNSWLVGNGYLNDALGFKAVYATAAAGGHDTAYLTDTGGNNTFNGTPTNSWLVGAGFLNDAIGFKAVCVTAGAGSNDIAYLTDTGGNNTFNGTATNSWLAGAGFLNDAIGFKRVYAIASAHSHDVAYLAGRGTFVRSPGNSYMAGAGFFNDALGFPAVYQV